MAPLCSLWGTSRFDFRLVSQDVNTGFSIYFPPTAAPSAAAPSTTGNLFGGGGSTLFGKKPDAPAATATAASTAPPTLPPFTLGGNQNTATTGQCNCCDL